MGFRVSLSFRDFESEGRLNRGDDPVRIPDQVGSDLDVLAIGLQLDDPSLLFA